MTEEKPRVHSLLLSLFKILLTLKMENRQRAYVVYSASPVICCSAAGCNIDKGPSKCERYFTAVGGIIWMTRWVLLQERSGAWLETKLG